MQTVMIVFGISPELIKMSDNDNDLMVDCVMGQHRVLQAFASRIHDRSKLHHSTRQLIPEKTTLGMFKLPRFIFYNAT